MIRTKSDLRDYLKMDAKANARSSIKASFFGDEIWKYIVVLRKLEYSTNSKKVYKLFYRWLFHRYSLKLGFEIPINVCDKGLSLPHRGPVIVAQNARLGKCCRLHEGVTIGATNGSDKAPVLGDNVFVATGAKIIGDIQIPSDVAIAANAVVIKSITESGTTWGGIPARKISDNDSHSNLPLFD